MKENIKDNKKRDEVLVRMLNTPPKPNKPLKEIKDSSSDKKER